MSLRKIAVLLAAFGLIVGAIGSGVGAQFLDSVTGTENISVGTFACKIVDASPAGAVIATDGKSVAYTAPTITSSAPGSAPFSFTVQNTGSIDQVLTTAKTGQTGNLGGYFSPMPATPSPVTLAAGASQAISTGIQWTALPNDALGRSGSMTWTVSCGENAPTAIFDNTPAIVPSNLASYGPEAYAFNEWGPGGTFAGTARKLATATVTMSSWACQSGAWNTNNCLTTPGATYSVPITFNVYNVGPSNAVGTLITTKQQTFNIPYRPSADATNCIGGNAGKWFDGTSCFNGKANNITFTFAGEALPSTAIFGITFNTRDYGYAPSGSSGPTDSLNIATYPANGVETAPSVGTWLPDGHSTYLSTGPAGGPSGLFGGPVTQMPTGPGDNFVGYMPAVQITATN